MLQPIRNLFIPNAKGINFQVSSHETPSIDSSDIFYAKLDKSTSASHGFTSK